MPSEHANERMEITLTLREVEWPQMSHSRPDEIVVYTDFEYYVCISFHKKKESAFGSNP